MVHWGLTAVGSPYGGIVCALLGADGLHVLGAVVWLLTWRRPGAACSRRWRAPAPSTGTSSAPSGW